jgi:hypothetical protein
MVVGTIAVSSTTRLCTLGAAAVGVVCGRAVGAAAVVAGATLGVPCAGLAAGAHPTSDTVKEQLSAPINKDLMLIAFSLLPGVICLFSLLPGNIVF